MCNYFVIRLLSPHSPQLPLQSVIPCFSQNALQQLAESGREHVGFTQRQVGVYRYTCSLKAVGLFTSISAAPSSDMSCSYTAFSSTEATVGVHSELSWGFYPLLIQHVGVKELIARKQKQKRVYISVTYPGLIIQLLFNSFLKNIFKHLRNTNSDVKTGC